MSKNGKQLRSGKVMGENSGSEAESSSTKTGTKLKTNENTNKMSQSIDKMCKIIPSFNGKMLDYQKFNLAGNLVWTSLTSKDEKHKFMQLIKLKLDGQAFEVVRYKDFNDFEQLSLALETQFCKKRSAGTVSSELVRISQGRFESAQSFANKIENLMFELNEICISKQGRESATVIQALNEEMALNSFQNGLKEPLRTIIKAHHFEKLSNAIAQAVEEELSHKPSTNYHSKIFCTNCNKPNHSYHECFKHKSNSNNFQKQVPQTSSHFPKFTPSRNTNFTSNSNQHSVSQHGQQIENETRNQLFCRYCKTNGHLIENCYKRQQNNHRRVNSQVYSNRVHNSGNLMKSEQEPNTSARIQDLEISVQQSQI